MGEGGTEGSLGVPSGTLAAITVIEIMMTIIVILLLLLLLLLIIIII